MNRRRWRDRTSPDTPDGDTEQPHAASHLSRWADCADEHRHRHRHGDPAGRHGHAHHRHGWANIPGPWDRVNQEVRGRRPGWRGRIHNEVRLYYGAHLHRKIFFSFGAVILFTVVEIALINHFLGVSMAGRPWRALFWFGVPTFLLWTASGRVARRMSRPLYELTRVAEKIGGGDLTARAATGWMPSGEVAVLSQAINDMAGRIAHQMAEQRELLAVVSHELRTPLSRIRLLIEIAREGQLGAKTLDEIERETVEIDTLVGELLASARLEFQALTTRPLDAGEVALRALERAGLAREKLTLPTPPRRFAADPTLVARALANLIDNARKHAGGLDVLSVSGDHAFVVFEVSDRGPGFATGDEARIFASFYRGQEPAEASSDAAPPRSHSSLGLGLALVKRIAEAHGGDITARNRAGGGATFTLRFAVTPPG